MKPPLTWLKMTPVTFSLPWNAFSSLPQLSSRRALSRDSTASPERVLDPLQIDLDGVADLDVVLPARPVELAQRHPALGLEAHIDDGEILLDRDHGALDDGAFLQIAGCERILQQRGKIFARRRGSS